MLTPKNIKAKTAIEYFKQGYYQKGKWLGKGAVMLGLKGEIKNHQVYDFIVQGLSPDGSKRLNKREVHSDKRKAAVDCTFAAPKSVSLCAFIGGDERLIQAHIRVVEKVLEEMESRYAQSRVMQGSKTQEVVKTGNMVIAKYDHIESRELDPHLHSHCLVMNMTQLPNGEWYSHLNDEIFRNQKLLGMMYQHYLAIEVQKLGYEIELKEHGQFDIKGYNQEDLIDFSKRRVQILALAGVDASSVEREKAWSKTRKNKENVAPEELKARWLDEAAALGIEIVRPGAPKLEHQSVRVDEKIFADAIRYCSERQVAFRVEDIQAFILAESKPTDIATIEPLISSSDQLIRIQEQNGIRYTTIAAVERELATINLMKAGQGKVSAIAHPKIAKAHLEQIELNAGQQQAVMMTLTTSDSFVAWQGVAGAGKTFALKEVLFLAQKLGYSVKGFAPSSKASSVLGQELTAETQTVARLLASKPPNEIEHHQIWIVDEAGLLSAKDAYRLFQRATLEQARVILVGDTKQLSAVEAGNPFKSLQQAGIKTAYLNESQRQKNSPQLKVAIDLLAQGRIEAGFARLKEIESIHKVTRETKTEEIVKAYLQTPREKRAKTLVLAGTNLERIELTRSLRKALQAEGYLGSDVTLTQLKSKDLRQVLLGYTSHFAVGDLVMPLRNYKRKGLEKGELYEVIGSFTDTIKLKAPDGRELDVNLDFKKAVYQREQIEIAVGDRLVWKKNNHKQGRVNGQDVTVVAINGNAVKVIDAQGKAQTLDLKSPHHLDHGIVRTTFSAQGETADCVLVAADSTIGKESFYVASSRARLELRFFTTDENELLQWAIRSRAQENPLELIRNQVKQQQEQLVEGRQSQTTPIAEVYSPLPITYPAPRLENKRSQPPTPKPFKRIETRKQQPSSPAITPEFTLRPIPQPKISTQPFWTPTPAGVPPRQIDEKHWLELVEGSAIHPALAVSNVRSLEIDSIEQEHEAWEYLMYSDKLERKNTGQLSSGILKRYRHIENGGWWASAGIDARFLPLLQPGEKPLVKLWGCFKPDCPRVDADKSLKKGKTEYIKYEHPLKEERQLFLFDVPDALAQRIYDKYGVQPTQAEKQSGFWYITYKYNLPITLAEGAKKTLSSLSQGEITIGVSGVNGGYYANDSEHNRLPQRILHPELEVFATRGREFRFALDQDTKQSTIWNVRRDMVRTGELLELEGCTVRVVQWEPDKGKGLDDLIHNQGPLAYALALSNSIPLATEAQKHYRAEYNRLSKKVLSHQPALPDEAIDIEVYKLARFKGDIRDGARTIAQSNQARSFKAMMPTDEAREKTFLYIGQIEILISVQSRQLKSEQQQPVHQSNEAYYDINTQSFKPEREVTADTSNERNGLIDRKTDGVANKQHQADGENRLTREQPNSTEGGSDLSANQPEPNPQRVYAQMGQLLAATNQYVERQEAERTSANFEGFYHSPTERRLSSRGAKELTNADEQQYAAILDSPRTDARIDPQITRTETTRQCLNAIAEYTLQQSIETAIIENLPALTQKLNQLTHKRTQTEQLDESLPKQAIDAITKYIEQQSIEATIVENLPALTQKLNQTTQKRTQTEQLDETLPKQVIDAIAQYIEQQSIESALIETLPAYCEQLHQLTQKFDRAEQLNESLQIQTIDVIAEYIQQQSIEAALSKNLPALSRKLNQLTGQDYRQSEQLDEFLPKQAIDVIAQYIQQESIEATIVEKLPTLSEQLNQLTQKSTQTERLDEALPKQAIDAIAEYTLQQSIETAIIKNLPILSEQLDQLIEQKLDQTKQLHDSLQTQAIDAITKYIQSENIESLLVENLPALTQKLNQLTEQKIGQTERVDKLLQTHVIDANAPQLRHLRQIEDTQLPEKLHKAAVQPISQVFMGSQPQPNLLKPIQNHGPGYKPIGGIWSSPYQPDYGSEWAAFVHTEQMPFYPPKQQLWLVVPKPNLKIFVVDSPEKLEALPHLPPHIEGDNVCPLDYEAIALEYDALVIKPQMLRGSPEVATFDVESTIWFGSREYPFASVEPLTHEAVQYWANQPSIDSSPNQSLTLTSKNKEQVSVGESVSVKNLEKWKQVAIALGKPQAYINRVAATTKAVETGVILPDNLVPSMQQDFQAYQQISNDLSVWYNAAKSMGKSEQYLSQIKQVAIAFHDPCVPTPLSPKAIGKMQQDLQKHEQLQIQNLWQHYSLAVEPVRPIMKANAVAHAALIDNHPTEMIYKILKHDPQCAEIRQRSGEQALQNHLKVSLQSALTKIQQNKPNQVYQQRQSKQQPGFEL